MDYRALGAAVDWIAKNRALTPEGRRYLICQLAIEHGLTFANATPAKLIKQTDKAVRAWFRERVATWPDDKPAPTEPDDIVAIGQKFSELTRPEFRAIR